MFAALAELSPRRPSVAGVACSISRPSPTTRPGASPFASIGTFSSNAEFSAYLRLTLPNPPAGSGALVTCRASGIAVGPSFPGFYRVEGPGVAASFEDIGNPTTFTVFVPAGGNGPVEIKVRTDPDRIRLWAFYDCAITQV